MSSSSIKDERKELSQLVKKEKIAAKKRTHAQVLLLADCGQHGPAWKDEAIAEACRVTVRTVENIRKRLVLEGLDAALNRKPQVRLSRQKILDGEKEAKVIALCCGAKPCGPRTLDVAAAGRTGRRTGHRRIDFPRDGAPVSKKNELKPWQKSMWCIPPKHNAEFVFHMENVLEVYQRPYDPRFPLICMDELSKQLTIETQTKRASAH